MSSSPSRSNTDQRRLALTESSRELARQATRNEKEAVQASPARYIEQFANYSEINKIVSQDATPEKLRAFTVLVKQIVYTRITALTKGFCVMNRSLLASDDVDTILLHAEVHFPFTFNYQLALVISARIRKDVPKEKKLASLWSMIESFRKRNKNYCTAFATIVALSLMGGATPDSVIVFLQKMGVSVGKTSVLNEIRSVKAQVDNSASWLATEKYLCAWIDNLQYILPVKVQSEGRANNEVAGTSRLMLRVKEYVPPDMVAFETFAAP